MLLLQNLFLVALQLRATSGLRVLGNGLGLPVYGAEHTIVVDYAVLDEDKKGTLPKQVPAQC